MICFKSLRFFVIFVNLQNLSKNVIRIVTFFPYHFFLTWFDFWMLFLAYIDKMFENCLLSKQVAGVLALIIICKRKNSINFGERINHWRPKIQRIWPTKNYFDNISKDKFVQFLFRSVAEVENALCIE